MAERGGFTAWRLVELLDVARALTEELACRLADPGLLDVIARFPAGPEADRSSQWGLFALDGYGGGSTGADGCVPGESEPGEPVPDPFVPDGSLPVIQLQVEDLARQMEVARTVLAGHVDRVFDEPVQRREVLGIPEGKSAYRNSAEYLCHHLRIRRTEARRRIGRASLVMPRRSLDQSQVLPPKMPVLAGAFHRRQADTASVDVIADTLDAARRGAALAGADPRLVDGMISDGERVLGSQAKDSDPDTMKKACSYWRQRFDALANPDGVEPTEAQAKAAQGLFYHGRGPANLHEWSLQAGDAQHEILKTIASAASSHRRNPAPPFAGLGTPEGRSGPAEDATERGSTDGTRSAAGGPMQDLASGASNGASGASEPGASNAASGASGRAGSHGDAGHIASIDDEVEGADDSSSRPDGWSQAAVASDALDPRNRAQRELDGLISALIGALSLTTHGDGGARPQVLVTIDYQTLAGQLEDAGSTGTLISQAAYAGPVTPQTIRRMACDADLIPVVLGGKGEVLDVGRAHRLFPRRLRRAITARDGGCAAPACSIPSPWCEVHHVEHWENGGPTSVDNGVLLCSHHHHAVHAGSWEISVREGIPWFIPARHHDPERRPRRNRYWRPGALDEAA